MATGSEGMIFLPAVTSVYLLVRPTDIFLPTPDSLLVNLNESKEVRNALRGRYW